MLKWKPPASWRTTAAGIAALFAAIPGLLDCFADGFANWACLSQAIVPVLAAIGLLFAKDSVVTGGTVPATGEAAKRLEE